MLVWSVCVEEPAFPSAEVRMPVHVADQILGLLIKGWRNCKRATIDPARESQTSVLRGANCDQGREWWAVAVFVCRLRRPPPSPPPPLWERGGPAVPKAILARAGRGVSGGGGREGRVIPGSR